MHPPDASVHPAQLDRQHAQSIPSQPIPERPRATGFMVQKRSTSLKLNRPSTAPTGDGQVILPSISSGQANTPSEFSLEPSSSADGAFPNLSEPKSTRRDAVYAMHTLLEDDADFLSGSLEPRANASLRGADLPTTIPSDNLSSSANPDYDWATFITAYAAGRWDPHRTPNPPRSCQRISEAFRRFPLADPAKSLDKETPKLLSSTSLTDLPKAASENIAPLGSSNKIGEQPSLLPSVSDFNASPTVHRRPRPPFPLQLVLPAHRMRNSISTSLPNPSANQPPSSSISNADVHATVATMRWAAARVDISPLALPSPEHELTDPMRGVTATIPGSHSKDSSLNNDYAITPGGTRRSRLSDFWEGTTDIENGTTGLSQLTTVQASPADPVADPKAVEVLHPNGETSTILAQDPVSSSAPMNASLSLLVAPPATAPVLQEARSTPMVTTDYFGDVRPAIQVAVNPPDPPPISAPLSAPSTQVLMRTDNAIPESGASTVPAALPRRVCLTRQTSSPLPVSSPPESRYAGGRLHSESLASVKMGRAAKEEQMFSDLGYLAPPNPPDELERRRALYKFNIWNTGPDINFDRIAHLAKLVFHTKGVMISLIDCNEQWFKSEWGLKAPSCARAHSFCGHTVLQRGDEPMVVLDAQNDWRFAKNPLTTGPPFIRFYAGAPLRTQEGFNIGTLAVIDDLPREEFAPRQRHTLKEFAAIAMREMELWRDKIQLRIRDRIQTSMEQFSRECLEIDSEVHDHERPDLNLGSSMDKVYDRAAKLVKRTLDVEGVIVMDVSHCEVLESMSAEGSVSVTMHHGEPGEEMTKRQLTTEEYHKLNSFFAKHPDGRISEGIIPPSFKPFLPTHVQYALTVPIYNIDKRPFALICAYNANDHAKRFLEGHELSYLRAIGVIILSAVLKRRMILADKAKGLFISNISHELRTPLHGILAAAELLSESSLNHSQASFLQTVQACGTSLVETVNHVLDFTKLSGNTKGGGVENVIVPTTVDLMQLVEEAVDGCWIGHRARTAIMGDSGIGSVYSPPKEDQGSPAATRRKHVETVVDIGYRAEGWSVKCEKGGIRRVLMNLFGNSLKFTSDGYIHVLLRQLPCSEDFSPSKVKVELAVSDTGKGMSQNFLKNQLFHPFSQENPLQTGTGLGLAIVSSIVTSENVGGKVDVWSEESVGTEIKVVFPAEVADTTHKAPALEMESFKDEMSDNLPTVSLFGFSSPHKGVQLLNRSVRTYLTKWWGFEVVEDGDIIIVNDDPAPVVAATERRDTSHPFIILSSARGSPVIMSIASEHERIGGFCRILYKPGGPSRLRVILKLSLHALVIGKSREMSPLRLNKDAATGSEKDRSVSGSGIPRRNSEETHARTRSNLNRPTMTPRSSTAHPVPAVWRRPSPISDIPDSPDPDAPVPTITIGSSGTLLEASIGSLEPDDNEHRFRVLVVEDNTILRNLLIKWLSNKGYDFRAAVDGRDGVNVFEKEGPFDVVLLDLSMPILDGKSFQQRHETP
ncbi:unnamed protein product [Cyclocybe aegerita]|uniref:histidine kinase n=1 Tax=Cyclocybe aegerita TaxID=1973307 RepID=A0A8S0VYH2_CYCAE|nr:unnamed protein product [Cyclocybe aegerita]